VHNLAVRYRFDDSVLDTTRYELSYRGESVHVQPQVFEVLTHLVQHRDRVVPKAELLDVVWGHQFVSESALTTRIKQARQAVGDNGRDQRIVQTVHGRGYRFVAAVDELADAPERVTLPLPRDLRQEIRLCTAADGTRLAYATVGSGPPLVRAAHWITHLDYDWQSPVWRHWLEGLASHHQLVRYDERGCGLSDHDVEDFSLDAWVQDLETVVDDIGLDRFPLVGVSQGGAVAVAFAARHPERVSRLVLYGAYAEGRLRRATSDELRREAAVQVEMVRLGWGREDPAFRRFFTSSFIPDAPPELWESFAELLRRTTSAENAARLLESWAQIDVTAEATRVTAPTLVLHARHELRVPPEQARRLAALIPGARFVPLDSRNHLLRADEPAWGEFLGQVEAFLS
jgi:pimeloyl-ACP methyl ester carboxylesterase